MTLAEANAAASSNNGGGLQPLKGWESTFRFGDPGGTITFCGDVLFALNMNIAGGLEAFAALAQELSAIYGPPSFVANHQYGSGGVIAHVRTTWINLTNDEIGLTLTTYAGGPLTAARAFSSHKGLCPQS